MNYSTLKEVYNVDTFEREKKKKKKIKSEEIEDEYSTSVSIPVVSVDKDIIKTPKITNIQPYYDEELEQYLQVNTESKVSPIYPLKDISNESNEINIQKSSNLSLNITPTIEPSNQIAKTALNTTQISQNSNVNTPIQVIKDTKDTKKEQFYKNMINIGLFVFIGILIIFLCDQITEISINIGMKKTMTLMETYLQEIRAKKDN